MKTWASLAMYAPRSGRAAWEQLWRSLRAAAEKEGLSPPAHLTWGDEALAWHRPGLFLSHCCGRPLALGHAGQAHVVGAFDFGLEGCPPGTYRSAILATDSTEPRAAINSLDSQSGYLALCDWLAQSPEAPLVTGSHVASIAALERGEASVAAIDAQTLALWQAGGGTLTRAKIIGWSTPYPGTPLVPHDATLVRPLRHAVQQALREEPEAARSLRLFGFVARDLRDYAGLA